MQHSLQLLQLGSISVGAVYIISVDIITHSSEPECDHVATPGGCKVLRRDNIFLIPPENYRDPGAGQAVACPVVQDCIIVVSYGRLKV